MISYIYKITLETGEVYIGSTLSMTLDKRLIKHKKYGNLGRDNNLDNSKIEALESFYYDYNEKKFHRTFLRKREQYYIDNNECINVLKAYRTEEDIKKTNKEKRDRYILNNHEKVKQGKRESYHRNKNKIK